MMVASHLETLERELPSNFSGTTTKNHTARQNIRRVLKENASNLKIASIVGNQDAIPGAPFHDRFVDARLSFEDSSVISAFTRSA